MVVVVVEGVATTDVDVLSVDREILGARHHLPVTGSLHLLALGHHTGAGVCCKAGGGAVFSSPLLGVEVTEAVLDASDAD